MSEAITAKNTTAKPEDEKNWLCILRDFNNEHKGMWCGKAWGEACYVHDKPNIGSINDRVLCQGCREAHIPWWQLSG